MGERLDMAKDILETYLVANSAKEVNLEHGTRVQMESMYARMDRNLMNDCEAKRFEIVYEEVRAMLLENVWAKYKEKYGDQKKNGNGKKLKGLGSVFGKKR